MGSIHSCLGVSPVDQTLSGRPRFLIDDSHNALLRLHSSARSAAAAVASVPSFQSNNLSNTKNSEIVKQSGKKFNDYSPSHQQRILSSPNTTLKLYGAKSGNVIYKFFKKSKLVKKAQIATNRNNLSTKNGLDSASFSHHQHHQNGLNNVGVNLTANNCNSPFQAKLVDIDDHPFELSTNGVGTNIQQSSNTNNSTNINSNKASIHLNSDKLLSTDQSQQNSSSREPRKVLIALFDYDPRTQEDLAVRKGDHLEAIDLLKSGDWWLAKSKTTKRYGYVPKNYVVELKSLGAEPWYFGLIGRLEAEKRLRSPGNEDGSFIIRDADTEQNRYSLSLRHKDEVKHYKIKQLDIGGYYLIKKTIFSTLHDFVLHYSTNADGLCVELRKPCITIDVKPTTQGLSYNTCDSYEIDRNQLELLQELGHGQFGQVYMGLWNKSTPVAIKTLKCGSMDPQEFITEAQIMQNLRHEKLVQLFAVCTREEPIYIVTELMKNGCLLNYLQKNKHLEIRDLIYIACQIAEGMTYLEQNNYLHRDLAARNILVGDNNIVKIADFGLARLIKETEYEARPHSKCPIKWTSPESIQFNRFTSKSDVWSFGIVLYEIITFGAVPYPKMSNSEMLQQVECGYRMPITQMPGCPKKLYAIMMECWNKEPSRRPSFDQLRKSLDNFFE